MKLRSVQAVIRAFDEAKVRFLVVGGVAVNAHGYRRFTADLDLVIGLDPANVRAAFTALASVGYRPRVPVTGDQFADRDLRAKLIEQKGMQVLQFWSDQHRETSLDLFVSEPFPFEEEYDAAVNMELRDAGVVRVVRIPALIRMKEEANRPQDVTDVYHLRMLMEET